MVKQYDKHCKKVFTIFLNSDNKMIIYNDNLKLEK